MSARRPIRIAELAPGQRAVDNIGGVWTRGEVCVFDPDGNPIPRSEFAVCEDFYGPFHTQGETPKTQERQA
jgi:hypothetical protein